jgi:fructose-specific phosphotransferase system component IIB
MNGKMSRHELKMADSLLRKLVKAEDSAVQLHLYMYCNDRNEDHQRRVRLIKLKISDTIRELERLINEATMREVPVNEGDVYGKDCRSGACDF